MIEAFNNALISRTQPSGGTTTWLGFFMRRFERLEGFHFYD